LSLIYQESIIMADYSVYSAPELVHLLGKRFKDYRIRANMTQKEVADAAGLTSLTVSRFEKGTVNNISLGSFLLLLKAIGCIDYLDDFLPNQPEMLYTYRDNQTKIQRVRHKNSEL